MQSLLRFILISVSPVLLFGASMTGAVIVSTSQAEAKCGTIKLICPSGQKISRKTTWDKKTLRCVTRGSLKSAVKKGCRTPSGVPKKNHEWWYKKASQDKACSGPVGDQMSGSKKYRLLHEACVMHDLCYRYSTKKKTCEGQFFKNMTALCKNRGLGDFATMSACLSTAGIVYAAAKTHKDFTKAYKSGQKELEKNRTSWTVRNRVYIDCNHSKVKSESTKSKVTIQVLDSKRKVIASKTHSKGISKSRCKKSYKALDYKKKASSKKAAQGRYVIVKISGGDAFLIDSIKLKVDDKKDLWWGRNNGKAWCLSKDKNDYKKSWKKVASSCYKKLEFRHNSGKGYGWH